MGEEGYRLSTEAEVDVGAWYDVGAGGGQNGEVGAAVGAIDNAVNVVGKRRKKQEHPEGLF